MQPKMKRARKEVEGKMICKHPGCTKVPSFNHPGETMSRYCSRHKEYGMVDVKNKR